MNASMPSGLQSLAARLKPVLSEVHVRGEGAAQFLYVVGNDRSAEVSMDQGRYWVEFWDSLDEDASPVAQAMYDSLQEVEDGLLPHLLQDPRPE